MDRLYASLIYILQLAARYASPLPTLAQSSSVTISLAKPQIPQTFPFRTPFLLIKSCVTTTHNTAIR